MKILITGTAGFIGFHLAKRLLESGNEIIGLDNINDYYDVCLKYARLRETGIERETIEYGKLVQSKTYSNYQFIKVNLEDERSLENLFACERFEVICHLAAQAGVRYSIENPRAYINSNIVGFTNILECCRYNPVKHLVYASSSSIYGNDTVAPFTESAKTDNPVSLYAATKKSNELLAYSYSYLYNIPATGLRFFTVYGPFGRPDMAPMLFAEAIYNEKPIKVFNNGNLSRDFTYIDDIIEGIVRVTEQSPSGITPPHMVYNIGCSQPVQLMDFINTMENAIGKKAILDMQPMQKGDVYKTFSDTTALMRECGYCARISLQEGMERFVEWYENYIQS
jgi:UDP-glucuronate 4-epimerase